MILCKATGVAEVAWLVFPGLEAAVIEGFQIVRDDERDDAAAQTFFEQQQAADAAVAVLEGVDTLEAVVEVLHRGIHPRPPVLRPKGVGSGQGKKGQRSKAEPCGTGAGRIEAPDEGSRGDPRSDAGGDRPHTGRGGERLRAALAIEKRESYRDGAQEAETGGILSVSAEHRPAGRGGEGAEIQRRQF